MCDAHTLTLRITAKSMLTPTICRFELRAADSGRLSSFDVGAHINVRSPSGACRSYSLNNGPDEPDVFVIAVARRGAGRGGSMSLVDDTEAGDTVMVAPPANGFALQPADGYLLIAGGVGITAVRAMHRHLRRAGRSSVRLVYLTRSPQDAAYLDDYRDDPDVVVHHSDDGRLDLWPLVRIPDDGTRVYCCGPPSLMDEVRALTAHWRPSLVHFEDFGASGGKAVDREFRAMWGPTGQQVEVPPGTTLLDALSDAGIVVPSGCSSGTCGSCRLRVLSGVPEHRDAVLDEALRSAFMTPCVSRSLSPHLVVGPAAV